MARYYRAITSEKGADDEEDIISSLPDSLLVHILSLLDDTKEAVKTCVLSKRWEFLWTELLEVNLNALDIHNDEEIGRFLDYVGRMIAMCRNLNNLAIGFRYKECFASKVNNWIYFAIKNKVKDITLVLPKIPKYDESIYELPQKLFSYSSLSNLNLRFCVMAPLGIIAWSSLVRLSIGGVELSDSAMENILSNCPVLETLHLHLDFRSLNYLNINSPNLTSLVLENIFFIDKNTVDISIPHLQILLIIINDPRVPRNQFRLKNVSPALWASIDFNNLSASDVNTMNDIKQLLESLRSVETLCLENQCLEFLSLLEVKSWKLPLFTKLRSFNLKVFSHEISIHGILAILRSSPNLNTLFIEGIRITDEKKKKLDQYGIRVKNCNLDLVAPHLTNVEISKFTEAHMLTLVQILLKSTKVLEEMVISLDAPSSKEISERIRTFPKVSPAGVVVLC